MLTRRSRGRRRREEGQALVLALAFIVLLSVAVVALLSFADVTGLQHAHTEATATNDSLAEGGAALAAADAGRSDVSLTCGASGSGVVKMQGGDSVQYTVNGCSGQGGAGGGPGPGPNCVLCILNQAPGWTAGSAVVQTQCAQCTGAALETTGGDVYVNGSIGSAGTPTSLTAIATVTPLTYAHIRILSGADASHCTCISSTPTPTAYAPAILDPLATMTAPSPAATEPKLCITSASCTPNVLCHNAPAATWDPVKGCSVGFSSTQAALGPGVWNQISVNGNPSTDITLADSSGTPGTFVITGPLSVAGNATVAGSDVTLYLACSNYLSGTPCSGSGGSVSFGGNGTTSISSSTSGQYRGIALIADPLLLDLGGANCASSGAGCMYSTAGNGASITGSIDTRSGGISLAGNAAQTISSGRLITNSLYMTISGRVGSGLAVSGTGTSGVSTSTCGVLDDNPVSGTAVAGGLYGIASTLPPPGRAVIQSQCGSSGALSGVIDFNYAP